MTSPANLTASARPSWKPSVVGESTVTQDYLKVVWAACEWGGAGASITGLAKRIGAAQVRVFEAPRAGLIVAGYGVDHLHLHVLPIRSEEDLSFSSARHPEGEELDAAMERLRAGLIEDGWGEFVPASLDSPAA